jgi:hypothetical protein
MAGQKAGADTASSGVPAAGAGIEAHNGSDFLAFDEIVPDIRRNLRRILQCANQRSIQLYLRSTVNFRFHGRVYVAISCQWMRMLQMPGSPARHD